MYSTNRNIQIKLNHKLCKIKSRYIKLQYNVWQDFSLARFQLHVFLRLVKPTLKADLWEQSMSDVALKSIRLFLWYGMGDRGERPARRFLFLSHESANNKSPIMQIYLIFVLECKYLIFALQCKYETYFHSKWLVNLHSHVINKLTRDCSCNMGYIFLDFTYCTRPIGSFNMKNLKKCIPHHTHHHTLTSTY